VEEIHTGEGSGRETKLREERDTPGPFNDDEDLKGIVWPSAEKQREFVEKAKELSEFQKKEMELAKAWNIVRLQEKALLRLTMNSTALRHLVMSYKEEFDNLIVQFDKLQSENLDALAELGKALK
jgi:hypothetical protein